MTSHTQCVATHTLDSDLIDEPAPANTQAHRHTHQPGGHTDLIIITPARMGRSSSAAMTLAIGSKSDD